MTINLQTGGFIPTPILPGARGADIQVEQKQVQYNTEISLPASGTLRADPIAIAQANRYDTVRAASQTLARDFYPVSDKSFTIYKDTSGQYITRYTSLLDGSVTYIPEQRLLQLFESRQQSLGAVVQLNA